MGGMIDGFRERARRVGALLEDPGTTFLLVASPEPEPVDEALFFWRKLRAARMPFGAAIVNRVRTGVPDADPDALAADLAPRVGEDLAARTAAALRDEQALAARDRASIARLGGQVGHKRIILVPQLDEDVHDAAGLVQIARYLADGTETAKNFPLAGRAA
jgi:anion-transporting  ArsA/GET3 family ATPase